MRSRTAVVGIVLCWLASLDWCWQYWNAGWPVGTFFVTGGIGIGLVLWAAYRIEDMAPIEISLTALIPPLILLALNGFRI
jgi:hypothetical protein